MYICLCNAITDRQIVRAAEEGARSSEDLAAQLGVGTGCGRCRSCAKALLVETIGRIACGPGGFTAARQGEPS
jgi:bacterioferritin-associated ferredoxin